MTQLFSRCLRFTGSLGATVVLLVFSAVLLGWATFIERQFGTPFVRYVVYSAWWFHGLLALYAVNVIAAALLRFPWKQRHIPFLIAHVGILVLLLGCYFTFRFGREAKMIIAEGTTVDTADLSKLWQFEFNCQGTKTSIPFSCGPLSRDTHSWSDWKKNVIDVDPTLRSNARGVGPTLSRFVAGVHNRAVWGLVRLAGSPAGLSFQAGKGVTVDLLDWLVNSTFKPVAPLVIQWENDETGKNNASESKLTLAFPSEVASWATRQIAPNGTRVILTLARSAHDTRAFLKAIPSAAADANGDFLQLVLIRDSEIFRLDRETLTAIAQQGDPALRLDLLANEEQFVRKRLADEQSRFKSLKKASSESLRPEHTVKDEEIRAGAKDLRDLQRQLRMSGNVIDSTVRQKFESLRSQQTAKARLMRLEHSSVDSDSFCRDLRSWLDELATAKKVLSVLAEKVKLGKSGCKIIEVQLTPTLLPGKTVFQGFTAVVRLETAEGKIDELRLHSEYPEANSTGESTGFSGCLWAEIDPKTTPSHTGYSWDPGLNSPRLELLQSTDDVLYYRYWDGHDHVTTGTAIPLTGSRDSLHQSDKIKPDVSDAKPFQITQYEFMDEPGIRLVTAPVQKETADEFHAKVRLRVTTDSMTETFWLRTLPLASVTSEQEAMLTKTLRLPSGTMSVSLTNKTVDPGFSLHVRQFKADYEPDSTTPSSFSSLVDYIPHVADNGTAIDKREKILIRMNRPGVFMDALRGGNWWAYQDSFRGPFFPGDYIFDHTVQGTLLPGETSPRERLYQTVITLNRDPGRGLKYFGSLLIVLGTALLIYGHPKKRGDDSEADRTPPDKNNTLLNESSGASLSLREQPQRKDMSLIKARSITRIQTCSLPIHMTLSKSNVKKLFAIIFLCMVSGMGSLSAKESMAPNRLAWRSLPVMSDGRRMPLDTFSRIAVREICGTTAPVLSLNENLLVALKKNEAIGLPSFDEFVKEGKYSAEEKVRLKEWYESVSSRIITRQKEIVKRLKVLFPSGSRRFEHDELLFHWICEPDVWEYIPFISDKNRVVGSLVLQKKNPGRFLAPVELGDERFTRILQTVLDRRQGEAVTRTEANLQLTTRAAVAAAEAAASYFRALSFNPEKDTSPLVGYYLDAIMYPGTNDAPLIEKLDQSVKELVRLARQESKTVTDSPFLDPEFLLAKTTPIETAEKSDHNQVILLMRQINLVEKIHREYPLAMNAVIFDRIYGAITQALTVMRKHRDRVFRENVGSKEYREALLRTVYWTEEVADRLRLACGALTDNGRYVVRKQGKARSEQLSGPASDTVWSVPVCVELEYLPRGATMKIIPSIWPAGREAGQNVSSPWVSIQTVLFAPDCLYKRFVNAHLPPMANEKQPSSQRKDVSLSVLESLARLSAEGNPARAERKEFFAAANSLVAGNDEWGKSLEPFAQSLRRVADANATELARLAASESTDEQSAASLFRKLCYPPVGSLDAELFYSRINAFYWNWVFCLIAFCFLSVSCVWGWFAKRTHNDSHAVKPVPYPDDILYMLGGCFLVCSCAVTLLGGATRAWITGWAPVTNMFETVVLLGFLVALFSLVYALWPVFGSTVSNAWRCSALSAFRRTNPDGYSRRISLKMFVPHLLLIGLTVWGTLHVCYREHAFDEGILKAFRESFAMQGMLDRIAVLAAMLFVIWGIPRCIVAVIIAICSRSSLTDRKENVWSAILSSRERQIVLLAGTTFALAIGMLAFFNTVEFNPNIRPLTAVLRSNFWLTIHVLAIIISYALGTIAWGIALVMLGAFIFRSDTNRGQDQSTTSVPPICLRLAPVVLNLIRGLVLFLALGIILGARWADFSWGRFWSWDPKEVWALVTLLIYLVVLHDRKRHARGVFGLAAGAVLGAFAIIMTWYGLSFVFGGGGRHAYVSGESQKTLALFGLLAANLVWTFLAWCRLGKSTRSTPN